MFSFSEPAELEPISPELALVSPELAAIARAALPDRPWEAFFSAAADDAFPLRPPAIVRIAVAAGEPAPEADAPRPAARRRPTVPVGMLLLAAFVGLVVAGSVLPVRDAPTLGPLPARANGLSVPQNPVGPQTPQVETVPTPATVREAPPRRSATTSTSTTTTTTPAAQRSVSSQARQPGGYILARGFGILRVGASGRTIAEIRANIGCGLQVVTKQIRIAPSGRFSARATTRGSTRSTVVVTGVFGRAGAVHGTIRVTRGRCERGPVRFSGRLS